MERGRIKRIVEIVALIVIVAGLAGYVAVKRWDLTNPYRDGTTHAATMTYPKNESGCMEDWSVHLGKYAWHAVSLPPWGRTKVSGKLHIIHSQHSSESYSGDGSPDATFTARGHTLEMSGGIVPEFSLLPCSVQTDAPSVTSPG